MKSRLNTFHVFNLGLLCISTSNTYTLISMQFIKGDVHVWTFKVGYH